MWCIHSATFKIFNEMKLLWKEEKTSEKKKEPLMELRSQEERAFMENTIWALLIMSLLHSNQASFPYSQASYFKALERDFQTTCSRKLADINSKSTILQVTLR